MINFDQEWFFNCTLLAQNELLEGTPLPLNYSQVIVRAKEIYLEGYKNKIKEFIEDNPSVKQSLEATKAQEKAIKAAGSVDYKICHGCGEEIPVGWTKHQRKTTGEKCGYEFSP